MTVSAIPVTLADVLRSMVAAAIRLGDVAAANDGSGGTARWFHGEEYLDANTTPPRVVCVQNPDGAGIGPVLAVGARQVAGVTETVHVHIWGAGPSDDARLDDARARAVRIVNLFQAWAPGRLRGKQLDRATTPRLLKFGEELLLVYAYTWAVPEDADVFADAYANPPAVLSPPIPDQPQGPTGSIFGVGTVTLDNARPS